VSFRGFIMLDFHSHVRSRNYLSRHEQRRLLAWVMGVGLIVLACVMYGEVREFVQARSVRAAHSIDTRFQAEPGHSGEPDAVSIRSSVAVESSHERGDFPGVSSALLAQIHDDTPWIRSDELPAWLELWDVLRQSDERQLAAESKGKIGFVELFQQPKAFRGKLVTVRGSARQATYLKAGENSHGLEGYYRVIIWPDDGPAEPIFLYVLELPDGFPTGEEIRADLQATGIFFKRMVYPTQQEAELRRAPVIMARTVTWLEPAEVTPVGDSTPLPLMLGLTALGIVGLIFAIAWATRERVYARARLTATIEPIDERDVVDLRESLGKLAENDR